MTLTKRQRDVLDFIQTFWTRNGYTPTFQEIADGIGLKSIATVHKHLTNFRKERAHKESGWPQPVC